MHLPHGEEHTQATARRYEASSTVEGREFFVILHLLLKPFSEQILLPVAKQVHWNHWECVNVEAKQAIEKYITDSSDLLPECLVRSLEIARCHLQWQIAPDAPEDADQVNDLNLAADAFASVLDATISVFQRKRKKSRSMLLFYLSHLVSSLQTLLALNDYTWIHMSFLTALLREIYHESRQLLRFVLFQPGLRLSLVEEAHVKEIMKNLRFFIIHILSSLKPAAKSAAPGNFESAIQLAFLILLELCNCECVSSPRQDHQKATQRPHS